MRSHSLADVAEVLIVSVRTVEFYIGNGELRAINVSRNRQSKKPRLRVLQSDLDDFLAARATDITPERQPKRRRHIEVVEQFV